jgi:outer membrane protein assembly factor BamA
MGFENDHRDSKVLPTSGFYLNLKLQGYAGLNTYSRSFMQFLPELSFYQHIDRDSSFVIANRIGAGATLGNAAFYQSVFLGAQENLLGYRKYRFAGDHMFYNNFELRLRLKKVNSRFIPGELGIVGFYDVGRVWQKGESSQKWHNGTGGSVYYAPIKKAVLRFTEGYSEEGWYPYVNIGLRF